MNGAASKEQRRNLKKVLGPEVAAALDEQRQLVQQAHNSQRVLAKQMQELEQTAAGLREGRAHDRRQLGAKLDDAAERLDALTARLSNFAEEHDSVVGKVDCQHAVFSRLLDQLEWRLNRVDGWIDRRQRLTRWQRLRSLITGRCALAYQALDPTDHNDDDPPAVAADVEVIPNPTMQQREDFFTKRTRVDAHMGAVGSE